VSSRLRILEQCYIIFKADKFPGRCIVERPFEKAGIERIECWENQHYENKNKCRHKKWKDGPP